MSAARTSLRAALAAAVLATGMAFVDATALVLALPAIGLDLGADALQLLWVNAAYAIPLTALLLPGGALGDRVGPERAFAWGVLLFAVSACGCGLAPSVGWLIALRAVQGAGAALMIPGSLALIIATFPSEQHGRAIGAWTGLTVIATIGGPVLGGLLAGAGQWRWIFFLNVPAALLVLWLVRTARPVRERAAPRGAPVDVAGAAYATLALGALSYVPLALPRHGFASVPVLGALAVGLTAGIVFVRHVRAASDPLVPPTLFRSRALRSAAAVTLLLYSAWNALLFFLPFNLIQVQGYEPAQAGVSQLPFIVLLAAVSWPAGRMADARGVRSPLLLGALAAAAGFALLAMPGLTAGPGEYATTFLPGLAVLGAGLGLCVAPLSSAVMHAVPRRVGLASAINSTLARLASVVGAAVLGPLVLLGFHATLGEQADAAAALAAPEGEVARGAFVDSFRLLCFVSAGLCLAAGLCVYAGFRKEDA